MPELPEVRNVVKAMDKALQNKTIKDIVINKEKLIKDLAPKDFENALKNKKIIKISNIGKFIIFFLSDDLVLLSHLRMEGKYHTSEWENNKHDHIIFNFSDGTKLYYNDTRQFGTFNLRNTSNYLSVRPLVDMGKVPSETDAKALFNKIKNRKVPIKLLLLDQSLLAGLGNIYVDEVLWKVKVHPETPSNKISLNKLEEILEASTEIMDKATLMGGSSIRTYSSFEGIKGHYQDELKIHMQINKPCFRCKTKIEKIKVGGRGTYYCPTCQRIA